MKKSMIAAAVVATASMAGAANATFFTISLGGIGTGPNPNMTFNGQMDTGTAAQAGLTGDAATLFAGTGEQTFSGTQAATIASTIAGALGATNNGDMTMFGLSNDAGTLGYFGIIFYGNASSMNITIDNASPPAAGVYVTDAAGGFSGSQYVFNGNTSAGTAYVWLFSGIGIGSTIGGNGTLADGSMTLRYAEFNGTNWVAASGVGSGNSVSINSATYSIPVPAPALLAGAGLVGAAALRRRMAKKA